MMPTVQVGQHTAASCTNICLATLACVVVAGKKEGAVWLTARSLSGALLQLLFKFTVQQMALSYSL